LTLFEAANNYREFKRKQADRRRRSLEARPDMKFLMIAVVVAAVVGAVIVGCGPQQAYCPSNSTGQCVQEIDGSQPPPADTGVGESIILNDV